AARHRRMAMDVRRRIARSRDRVGNTLEATRVATLARISGTNAGGRRDRLANGARGRSAGSAARARTERDCPGRSRAVPRDLWPTVPWTDADALRLSHLPDGWLLRIRDPRADRPCRQGLFDCDVADIHV